MMFEESDTPDEKLYECLTCGQRIATENFYGSCPSCGGELRNIAVPRE